MPWFKFDTRQSVFGNSFPAMNPSPTTLREIAQRSDSITEFGRHLRDWLHEVRRASSRRQLGSAIAAEPPRHLLIAFALVAKCYRLLS